MSLMFCSNVRLSQEAQYVKSESKATGKQY